MKRETRNILSKAVMTYPSHRRRKLLDLAAADSKPDINDLVEYDLHLLFGWISEDSVESPKTREAEVREVLGSLKKQPNIEQAASDFEKIFSALAQSYVFSDLDFWSDYFKYYAQAQTEAVEEFKSAIRREFGNIGYILESKAQKAALEFYSTQPSKEEVSNVAQKVGVRVLPDFSADLLDVWECKIGRTLAEVFTPSASGNGGEQLTSDSVILSEKSSVGSKRELDSLIEFFEARSSELELANFIHALQAFMKSRELCIAEIAWSAILTTIERDRSDGALKSTTVRKLESFGLSPNFAESILANNVLSTGPTDNEPARNNAGPAADETPRQYDERVFEDVKYLYDRGKLSEAYAEIAKLSASQTFPLTRRYKDLIASIEQQFVELTSILNKGFSLLQQEDIDGAVDCVREAELIEPNCQRSLELESAIKKKRQLERDRSFKDSLQNARSALLNFDMPKATRFLDKARVLGGDGHAELQEVVDAVEHAYGDPFWGYRAGQPGAALNPFVAPKAVNINSLLKSREFIIASVSIFGGFVFDLVMPFINMVNPFSLVYYCVALYAIYRFFSRQHSLSMKLFYYMLAFVFMIVFLSELLSFHIGLFVGGLVGAIYARKLGLSIAIERRAEEVYRELERRSTELKSSGPRPELFI